MKTREAIAEKRLDFARAEIMAVHSRYLRLLRQEERLDRRQAALAYSSLPEDRKAEYLSIHRLKSGLRKQAAETSRRTARMAAEEFN